MSVVRDDLGAEVDVPRTPQRLVSLVPNLSETLWWWRLAGRVVGVTDWCVAPPGGFPAAERVRGTKNPDVRRIAALAPDLVVANEEENRELDVRRLREAGVAVYVTRVRTVADAADSLERLAAVLGVHALGRELAAALRRTLPGEAPSGVPTLCPIWRDPWFVVGRATFAGDLLAAAGAAVWHPPGDDRYPRVELAAARRAGIELVLLPDEPYPFDRADRATFADWDARVHLLDGAALTWWGPRTPSALAELTALVRARRPRVGPGGTGPDRAAGPPSSGARGRGTRRRRPPPGRP